MNTSVETISNAPSTLPPNNVNLVYLLYAIGFIFGITFLAAGIIALINRRDEENPMLKAHYEYQAKTFIWSVVWLVVGIFSFIIAVGFFVLAANYIWTLYRVIKGYLAFSKGKAIA